MKNFHPDNNCPVRNVLCRLGDKWSMLVLITLNANGTMRFCDIHKTIADISQRMLTVTLRITLFHQTPHSQYKPKVFFTYYQDIRSR